MHEFGIVEGIVSSVLSQLRSSNIRRVDTVHFRRGSAFSEEALRQAYQAATLEIETKNLDFICECGYEQVINSDDLEGHLFICPLCGAVHEVDEAHDLELVEIIAEMN